MSYFREIFKYKFKTQITRMKKHILRKPKW